MELSVGELDGLPLVVASDDGPAGVGLLVRVGWADEPLSRAGLSHLVEHLALCRISRPEHPWNGGVDATRTLFHAEGTPEQCAGFLHEVAAGLSALPLDRVEVEGRVLRSEATHHRSSTVSGRLLELRCGPEGYGACEREEFGLRALDPQEVRRWAAQRFTRRSAVAFWVGPPPPGRLSCPLPDGPAAPGPPPLRCRPGLHLPVYAHDDGPVALGLVMQRGWPAWAAAQVVQRRLQRALRHERGLAYDVLALHGPASAEVTHVAFAVDGAEERAAEAARVIDDVIGELAEEGPAEAELQEVRTLFTRIAEQARPWVHEQAERLAVGLPVQSPGEAARTLDALGPRDVAALLRDAASTAVLLLPYGAAPPPGRFRSLADADDVPPPSGDRFTTRALRRSARDVLVLGEVGLSLQPADQEPVVLRWDEVVLAEVDADGTHALTSLRGDWVRIRPADFHDQERVRELLASHLRPDLRVPARRAAGTAQVSELAPSQLGGLRNVGDELRMLGGVLRDGETLRLLGRGMSRLDLGLLAVTDQRTLFLFAPDDTVVEHPHHLQTGARSQRRLLAQDLVIEAADGETRYGDVDPKGRAEEMAEAVRRAVAGH